MKGTFKKIQLPFRNLAVVKFKYELGLSLTWQNIQTFLLEIFNCKWS